MSRTYARIGVAVACGLVLAVGCYTESTIDQVNQLPAKRPGQAKMKTGAASQPGRGTTAAKPTGAPDSKAKRVAQQAEQYRQRVKGGQTSRIPGKDTATRPTPPAVEQPGDSKQAVHVASDSFEAGKPQPMAAAEIDASAPWHRSGRKAPAKPAGSQARKQQPAPPVVAPKPEVPPAARTGGGSGPGVKAVTATAEPAKPTVKPATPAGKPPTSTGKLATPTAKPAAPVTTPKTDSTTKPQIATPLRRAEVARPKSPKPATAVAAGPQATGPQAAKPKPSPARATPARPVVSPAPADEAKASSDKTSGFIVPRPPAIPKMSAKSGAQKPARRPSAPPAKPTVVVKVPSTPKTTIERKKRAQPNQPAQTAPPFKRDMRAFIDQKLKEAAANPNDLAKQMVLRLLYLADRQPKNARSEIPGTKPQIQAIIDRLMKVNITALQSEGRDTAIAATKLLADVEKLREVLRPHADLEISTIKLCSKVDRFGVYDEIKPLRFQAGKRNQAIVYCEVKNFTTVPTEDSQWRVLLGQRIKVLNEKGETIYQTPNEDVPDTSRRRLEDFYLVRIVELPSGLRPGKYVLRVYAEDKLAGKASENQIEFRVTK